MEKMKKAIDDYREYKIEHSFSMNSFNNSKIMDDKLDSSKVTLIFKNDETL
jgi:hypothetical protein